MPLYRFHRCTHEQLWFLSSETFGNHRIHHRGVPPFREALRAPSPRGLHDPCGPRTAELCKGSQGLTP
jgi:hypothetical protein